MSYFDDNEDRIIYGSGRRVKAPTPKRGFTVTADDFDVVPEPCRYCDGTGYFYSEPDLGPCPCTGVEDLV